MAKRSDVIFDDGLDAFTAVVERLDPQDWARSSPCEGWTALDVLGHLGSSIQAGISMLEGNQPTWRPVDRPGELVGTDTPPADYWRSVAERARTALAGADLDLVMDTPMGKSSVADRLAFPAIDLYVHAWDIGRAAGFSVEVPEDVIEFAHSYIDPIPAEKARGKEGAFGPEVDAPTGATPTEAFIAWTGRPPR